MRVRFAFHRRNGTPNIKQMLLMLSQYRTIELLFPGNLIIFTSEFTKKIQSFFFQKTKSPSKSETLLILKEHAFKRKSLSSFI
jgi:hypothetical protein